MRRFLIVFFGLCFLMLPVLWINHAMGEQANQVSGLTADELLQILKEKGIITETDIEKIKDEQKKTEEKSYLKKTKVPYEVFAEGHALQFRSPSGNYWFNVRGYIHFDWRQYGGGSANASAFEIRRGRFDITGGAGKYVTIRCQNEMATKTPYLRNAWIDVHYWPWLSLKFGQHKPFFSTQWWTLDNRTVFLERASSNPVYPFFDRGFSFYGELFDDRFVWTYGIYTGAGIERDYGEGDVDDHKDHLLRFFYTPFKKSDNLWINNLHFCIQGMWGTQTVNTAGLENRGFRAQNRQSKIWKWNKTYKYEILGLDGVEHTISEDLYWTMDNRYRWGVEAHWIKGPFFASTELLRCGWTGLKPFELEEHPNLIKKYPELATLNKLKESHTTVWTIFGGYFLTGESMRVSNWGWALPAPKKYFNPHVRGYWGAIQPTFSYTLTKTTEDMFKYGVLEGAEEVHSFVIGLNWLWSAMIRLHFNYMYLHSSGANGLITGDHENNPVAPKEYREDEHMFGMRFKWTM